MKKVAEIINNEVGSKWEIFETEDKYGVYYTVKYYEYFSNVGWRLVSDKSDRYTKDCIEWEFNIELA